MKPLLLLCLFTFLLSPAFAKSDEWPIFAMDNGLGQIKSVEEKAEILHNLGYTGIGWRPPGTEAMASALKKYDMKVYTSYVQVDISPDGFTIPERTRQAVREMEGTGGAIWLLVAGQSDTDEDAIAGIIAVADLAKAAGLTVVVYPHVGKFITAEFFRALRIVKKINRPDVRLSLTLCHFLKMYDADKLEVAFKQAAPYLAIVQVSGADSGDTKSMDWDQLIQPVGEGSFDLSKIVKLLREIHYTGSITFQTYGIPGDNKTVLKKNIINWRKLVDSTN